MLCENIIKMVIYLVSLWYVSPELCNSVRIVGYGVAGDVILPKRQKCVHRDKNVEVCYSAPQILSNYLHSVLISIQKGGRRWLFEGENNCSC